MYDLGVARGAAQCEQGTANPTRHTFGARLWRHVWAYNAGAIFQAARFGWQAVQLPIKGNCDGPAAPHSHPQRRRSSCCS